MSAPSQTVLSLSQLMRLNPTPDPALIGPSLLPAQGILFVGGEPKVGKSLLVANLALALAAGSSRTGFDIPAPARVLLCQFELPLEAFAARLAQMRHGLGSAADDNLWVDTRATGHLLSTPDGLNHFLTAARTAQAQVLVLDPLYSAHDQDENDTRSMAALCQSLLRLRQASQAALIVVHHVRKSVGRHEVGSALRGSSALHAVGDSYLLLRRPSAQPNSLELRFQFRYAPALSPRRLRLDPSTLWFTPSGQASTPAPSRRKVENTDVQEALHHLGATAGYNQLRDQIMRTCDCSKRTAQLALTRASEQRRILRDKGRYRLPPDFAAGSRRLQTPPAG